MSFKPEMLASKTGRYHPTDTAFATREEAEAAAALIKERTTTAIGWHVVESDGPVTHHIDAAGEIQLGSPEEPGP